MDFYSYVSLLEAMANKFQLGIWVCLKIVYLYTQWLMIIIPTKWLFHWGYTGIPHFQTYPYLLIRISIEFYWYAAATLQIIAVDRFFWLRWSCRKCTTRRAKIQAASHGVYRILKWPSNRNMFMTKHRFWGCYMANFHDKPWVLGIHRISLCNGSNGSGWF